MTWNKNVVFTVFTLLLLVVGCGSSKKTQQGTEVLNDGKLTVAWKWRSTDVVAGGNGAKQVLCLVAMDIANTSKSDIQITFVSIHFQDRNGFELGTKAEQLDWITESPTGDPRIVARFKERGLFKDESLRPSESRHIEFKMYLLSDLLKDVHKTSIYANSP